MSRYLVDRIGEASNVEVLTNTSVVGARGEGRLEAVTVKDVASGETRGAAGGGDVHLHRRGAAHGDL